MAKPKMTKQELKGYFMGVISTAEGYTIEQIEAGVTPEILAAWRIKATAIMQHLEKNKVLNPRL